MMTLTTFVNSDTAILIQLNGTMFIELFRVIQLAEKFHFTNYKMLHEVKDLDGFIRKSENGHVILNLESKEYLGFVNINSTKILKVQ